MKTITSLLVFGLVLGITGCASSTRSISNSGPSPAGNQYPHPRTVIADALQSYRGELSEFDLLGVDRDQFVTDEQIAITLAGAREVHLKQGETILLIQSGASFPDGEMVSELENYFRVVPFNGVPTGRMQNASLQSDQPAYSRSFRLAAAQAGAAHIVCYWGNLESMRTDMHTKTMSWIPFAGWVVPDENQAMRIRLKLAVIDVKSGGWTMVSPNEFVDRNSRSNRFNRDRADQKQVQELKELAYAAGARQLISQLNRPTP